MNKTFCDCCGIELYTGEPEPILDETGRPKVIRAKRFDQSRNKFVEYETFETVQKPNEKVVVHLNLNHYDMIYREYCVECYKKIASDVKKVWDILCATSNL